MSKRASNLFLLLAIVATGVVMGLPVVTGAEYDEAYPCREALPVHIPGDLGASQVLHIDVPDDLSDATEAVLTVEAYDVDWGNEAAMYLAGDRYSIPVTGDEQVDTFLFEISLDTVGMGMEFTFVYERDETSAGYDVNDLYLTITYFIEENQPPVAEAGSSYTGQEGTTLQLDGTDSYDPDGTIVTYAWTFGDGETGTGITVDHTYLQDGVYTITLTVTDNEGAVNSDTTTATIRDTGPTAAFSASPLSGDVPLLVSFRDLSTSYDGIIAWTWDFGDSKRSTKQHPSHTYKVAGTFTATLTVTEDDGDQDTAAVSITASITPPTSVIGGPYSGREGEAITFDGSASYDRKYPIVKYEWDFGDGETGIGVTVEHVYLLDGAYIVTLTVTNNQSITDTDTTTVPVEDTDPTAVFSASPVAGPAPLTVTFTDESTSYDGIVAWTWDFGDNTTSTNPYTNHTYQKGGTFRVSLTVVEADGDADTSYLGNYVSVAMPDLMVTDLTWRPLSPELGEAVTFYYVVENRGGANASAFSCVAFLDDQSVHEVTIDSLPPGTSQTLSFAYLYELSLGSSRVEVIVDRHNTIDEHDELNNVRDAVFNIVDQTPPTVSSLHIDTSNPEMITFSVTVQDTGGSGLAGVGLYVDGEQIDEWTTPGTYTKQAGPYQNGAHTCYVEAIDQAGNHAMTQVETFHIGVSAFPWHWLMVALILVATLFSVSYVLLARM